MYVSAHLSDITAYLLKNSNTGNELPKTKKVTILYNAKKCENGYIKKK